MQAKRYFSIIVGIILLGVAFALWAGPEKHEEMSQHHTAVQIRVAAVQKSITRRNVTFSGLTRARQRSTLAFSVSGRLNQRPVVEGTYVEIGQVLAQLDDREFRNAIIQTEAKVAELKTRLAQANRDYHRMKILEASKAVSTETLEKTITAKQALKEMIRSAEALLKDTHRLLSETTLIAPYNGTVTAVHVEPGEWIAPGQPVLSLSGDGPLEVMVEVPETVVMHLKSGQSVTAEFPFSEHRKITGQIGSVSKASLAVGRLFPVKVDIAATEGFTAGMTAKIHFLLENNNALTIPMEAVVNPGASHPWVFVHKNGLIIRQPVQLGRLLKDRIIVRQGLSVGEEVVISGHSRLADGDQVEVTS